MLGHIREFRNRFVARRRSKAEAELLYWTGRHEAEGTLRHDHYEWFYTREFGLTRQDYVNKRVLDIGCGPRGSLEWADCVAERVGLDPLVEKYRALGIDNHRMRYVASSAETIPFQDGHFDIVTTFNSLDHVDNVAAAIREITRVTKPTGIALVIVEVNHPPTPAEPHLLPWDLFDQFTGWSVEMVKQTSIGPEHNVFASYRNGAPRVNGPGILGGRLRRLDAN